MWFILLCISYNRSFSRSAVNHKSGAKTGLAGLTMEVIMWCALLFMPPLFRDIPQCALAAIVISAVMGLVDYDESIFLWRVDKKDFFLWTITSVTTLFLGIEYGVLIWVGFSLAFVIHESTNSHIAVLGRLPGTTVYRNNKQYPEAYTYHGPIPDGADAVVQVEDAEEVKDASGSESKHVRILVQAQQGQDIRPVGCDIEKGVIVLKSGELIRAFQIGLLATMGVMMVNVFPNPTIAVLYTGDELVEPVTGSLSRGQIRDSNRTMLMEIASRQYCKVLDLALQLLLMRSPEPSDSSLHIWLQR